jgi:hypothetical protein
MTMHIDYRTCNARLGDLFAANNGRYTQLRGHVVVINHQAWIAIGGQRTDQVSLTIPDHPYLLNAPADPACQPAVFEMFRDVADNLTPYEPAPGLQAGKWYIVDLPQTATFNPGVRGPFETAQDAWARNDKTLGRQLSGSYVWQCPGE